MDEKLALLKAVPLFADLDSRSLEAIGVLAREVDLPPDHVLMVEGEPGDRFYLLVEGTVRIDRGGAPLRSMTAGGFLGEIALLERGPRTATATCVTDCRLLAIERHEFERVLTAFPHIERRIRTAVARRPHGAPEAF
jgi:CRP/FNR family transcriptional regulator, cyclic AMP receptor protein